MATIKVLANARQLVDALAEHGPLSPAEAAELIRIPRPSVYRLAGALEAVDLVETLDDARIALSRRWLHLADAAGSAMTEWAGVDAVLDGIVEATGQTAFLSVPRANGAVCVAWSPGRGMGVLLLKPGRSLPYHAGAAGRVLLAFQQPDPEALLSDAPLPALTPRTLVDADALRADIAATRERGYSISDEDVTVGIGALGVPVRDARGAVRASLSLSGFAEAIREAQEEYVGVLRDAVTRITLA